MSDHFQPYFGKQALSTKESSHDTFNADNHKNWLSNEAGLGIYAHGRIHQQVGFTVYVGDMIHKRGHLMTDDVLLMEEQNLLSMGEPLSAPSRLGPLKAMAVLPTMNTANGEGALIGYYENGVVSFDTFEIPRETRHDGEGQMIQKGWDTKRLVNHLLNSVSAVGRYAVSILTRDHLFRSRRGLHFLKTVLGDGSFNTEQTNRISSDVDPILDTDPVADLSGCATGFWIAGDRMLASTGMVRDIEISSDSFGRGFVVWNQASTFTENRTPIPVWEGLWTFDHGIAGVHLFLDKDGEFGFVCSDKDSSLYHATFVMGAEHDIRNSKEIPIEWSFETGAYAPAGIGTRVSINDATVELLVSDLSRVIRVLIRTDSCGVWTRWKNLRPSDKSAGTGQKLLFNEALGKPPVDCRDATWVELRLEGVGYAEVRLITLDFSPSTSKSGRNQNRLVERVEKDFFEINNTPFDERWPQQE